MNRRTLLASVAVGWLLAPSAVLSQTAVFPAPGKVIKIVVPTAAGGGNDVMARLIARKLSERLKGHSVIVENMPGANGAIGSGNVARAPADGHTLLFGYIATHGINPGLSKLPYDAVKDFSPITLVAEAPGALVVHPGVEAKTVQELIALAKAKPGVLNYASAGNGTAPHISGELFKLMTGVDLVHVPYKGSGPAVNDTLAGHAQIMFPSLVAASQHIKSGKLRGLAVTSRKRTALFPDLPTIDESGAAGFEITQWYGLLAPAKTPKATIDLLHSELVAVMKDEDTVKRFAEQGADAVTSTPEEFGRFIEAEIAKWRQVIQKANITAD